MKTKHLFSILILSLVVGLVGCGKKQKTTHIDPGYGQYVTAFTSGVIAKQAPIKIQFAKDVSFSYTPDKAIEDGLLKFRPAVEGKAYMKNPRLMEFYPDKPMASGQSYTASLQLGRCLTGVEDKYKVLKFVFKTLEQHFSVHEGGLQSYPNGEMYMQRYKAYVSTADAMPDEDVEQLITADYNNKNVPITWSHSANGIQHHFTVDSLFRGQSEGELRILWDGSSIGLDEEGSFEYQVPPINQFAMLNAKVVQQPEQFVKLTFSDPIDSKQDLKGLVRLSGVDELRYIVEGNQLKVYADTYLKGEHTLKVAKAVRNIAGARMNEAYEMDLVFRSRKPAVRLLGKGVISPSSQGLVVPFEAVALRAVQLRVIQIYEDNVPQFLQNNRMEGSSDLRNVARLVLQKRIALDQRPGTDLYQWNTFSIDLSDMIAVEPGAIYRVELRFFRPDAIYACDDSEAADMASIDYLSQEDSFEKEVERWNRPGWYNSYYYPDNYRWKDEDNPCTDSYYNGDRFVHKNIFASDLGVIAKKGSNNKLTLIVSNLLSAKPEEGVQIDVLNYQNQSMGKCQTNKNGIAEIQLEYAPYLIVAKKGSKRAYLLLEDGRSLSLSSFDVGGELVQKGIKAYIYGERGVWRPGDKIYLTFILNDEDNNLPKNHPVVMEFVNPNGQVSMRRVKAKGENGFFTFVAETQDDDPTGNWTARFKVGGVAFSKTIKVETVKPNRLKIDLAFNSEVLYADADKQKIQLNTAWLSGATASQLKAQVNMYCRPIKTVFPGFPNFVFDDPSKSFYGEERRLFEGKTNSNGQAEIAVDLESNNSAPGMLRANFVTKVFEAGGEFSINMQQKPFAPYTSFVGLRMPNDKDGWYLTDTDYEVDVASVDADGKPIALSNLKVDIYKVDWRWWWDASDENLASYVQSSSSNKVKSYTVSTRKGKGRFALRVPYHDWHDYGRYLIHVHDKASGHSAGVLCYFSKWYGQSPDELLGNASLLTVSTDKEAYQIGEKVKVSIPSAKGSKALVSIENGSKVLKTFWVDAQAKSTDFSFEVRPDMAPNAYVSVSLIQPHAQTQNDRPIRIYGVCPFGVEDPDTKLQPQITMPKVLEPENTFTVEVNEASGRPMTYTLAVVDEGLLDLTNFKTPSPWHHFYAREALGISTWDMYNQVIGAYGARLERAFAVGGDENLNKEDATKANRFKQVSMFFGPFQLKAGKSMKHTIAMPNYVGAVRTMVVAGRGHAFGHAEESSQVRKPLMVLATLPRVLGPKEKVKLPVTVFAMEHRIKNVQVEVKTDKLLSLQGQHKKTVRFDKIGDKLVSFDVEVAAQLGVSKLQVIASSAGHKAVYDIEIDIRNPNPKVHYIQDTVLQAGATWQALVDVPGMPGTNSSIAELSTMPPMNFSGRLAALIDYPHGCIEQTSSAAFPQLFLPQMTDLSEAQKSQIDKNVQAGINRLQRFQLSDGGFSYWPGGNYPADWGTSYAGHFMLLAAEKGYSLPMGLKKQWISYQEAAARDWERGSYRGGTYYAHPPLLQAYRLFTLALANAADMAAMNRLREQGELGALSKWVLAAAYQLSGQPQTAQQLTAQLPVLAGETDADAYSYGSDVRNKAMILNSLSVMQQYAKGFPLAQDISKALSSNDWMSTQTTAFALVAMAQFSGQDRAAKAIQCSYAINGGAQKQVNSQQPLVRFEVPTDKAKPRLKISNTGKGMLYVRLNNSGLPLVGKEKAAQQNMDMKVVYRDMDGKLLDVTNIPQGTDFVATVAIRNTSHQDYSNMALSQIFPSGWEILNTRFGEVDTKTTGDEPTYRDIRDDRVHSYFDIEAGKQKVFSIRLNAAYQGHFYMPSVLCESMYNHSIFARTAGQWVWVK